ncbi:hypothetical protein WAI453_007933 [Rhynchosporium graminicola]
MSGTEKYTIKVPDAKILKLKQKLEVADLPGHETEGAGWKYGVPVRHQTPCQPLANLLQLALPRSNT